MTLGARDWIMTFRISLTLVAIAGLGLLARAMPVPPSRPRHRASRRRPTWTATPLYHALGLEALPAPAASLRRARRAGATSYVNLAKLSRFTRALARPNSTVALVRAVTPPEDD
jgi:hypothetical protein